MQCPWHVMKQCCFETYLRVVLPHWNKLFESCSTCFKFKLTFSIHQCYSSPFSLSTSPFVVWMAGKVHFTHFYKKKENDLPNTKEIIYSPKSFYKVATQERKEKLSKTFVLLFSSLATKTFHPLVATAYQSPSWNLILEDICSASVTVSS